MEVLKLNWSYSCWPMPQPQPCQIYLVSDLHHSSWQHWILNPPSRARDETCILMDNSQLLNSLKLFYWDFLAFTFNALFTFSFLSFFFFFKLYWSIVDLKCCISSRCTAVWISYMYTYIHSFSHIDYYKLLSRFTFSFTAFIFLTSVNFCLSDPF